VLFSEHNIVEGDRMNTRRVALIMVMVVGICATGCATRQELSPSDGSTWQEEFDLAGCTMATTGRNDYFILEPGFQLVLEDTNLRGAHEKLAITVLDETKEVDGVVTRVVEEREWKNDQVTEVSRNLFAICQETKDVYYFGEEVDMYKDGQLASHKGAWLAGANGARAGLIMPGEPEVGMKYYQEIAPDVAMDRAEIVSLDEVLDTPAGSFPNSMKTQEGTALNPLEREFKVYAPGIGLIQDADLVLIEYRSSAVRD
jgi:hypothetical protein